MFSRVFYFFVLLIFITSCDQFSLKKENTLQKLDTLVDFTSVDFSPSFKVCDSLIDKTAKENCFRNTIHQKIGEELKKHIFTSKDTINETIFVDLIINSNGEIVLKEIQSSENIKNQLLALDSIIQLAVDQLPIVHAAIKRGMPVTTKYQLPIQIRLQE
ncbi:hypothetical protein K8354_12105 [Polaribacter litorisediminis]|uniref:hypothetical protein n=1 Tax=Polaribacter litorisediminis TaxID=1908341 RepID=UPI001CBD2587|nr:hypothetical protein [Polaribacter litorisediminis]UAM97063.1 hypothetical protein K8354_12105 [Polaribacter litorisediminis]